MRRLPFQSLPPHAGWFLEQLRTTHSAPQPQRALQTNPLLAAAAAAAAPAVLLRAEPRHLQHDKLAIEPDLMSDIVSLSKRRETGVSLRYILDFGSHPLAQQLLLSARFLHQELPVRFAHRIEELTYGLPHELANNIHIRRVKRWYADSFTEMRNLPMVKDEHDVKNFTTLLRSAYARHTPVVPAVAKGVAEWKQMYGGNVEPGSDGWDAGMSLHNFLDNFFLSRIALRFLAGNHVALYEQTQLPDSKRQPDRIGLIHTKCKPFEVVEDAVERAREVCMHVIGDAPHVAIRGSRHLTLPYVPSHLHHMVFEVVKNSLRAVAERYDNSDRSPPDIQVVVATGKEDVTIKISDQGGGIPRSAVSRMFTYLYTTARNPLPDIDPDDDTYQNLPVVLAGYGCGLSLSRLYARYFGGDLQLFSMQGFGTDAFIHLARLGNPEEPLPGQGKGFLQRIKEPKPTWRN